MPKISKDCELEYISKIQKYVKKDPKKVEKLKIKLLNDNIKTVQYLARKFSRNNSESYDDLYQEGCLGFFYAIEKFEEGKGVRLATYASWWVRQYIQQYLHQHKRTIRMPVHITDQAGKIQKAKIELKEEYGRNPTDTELSNYLNLTDKQIIHVETSAQSIASLDFVIGDDTTLGDVIEDDDANSLCLNNESIRFRWF